MTSEVVQITDVVCVHGEGPVWSPTWDSLRVLDMLEGTIVSIDGDGTASRHKVGDVVALTRPRAPGGWVCVTDRGLLAASEDRLDADLTLVSELWSDPAVRPNEGGCAPDGGLLIGSTSWDGIDGLGELLRVDPDGSVRRILTGLGVSNGLGWTADGRFAYYIDSGTRVIERFRWSPETSLTDRTTWAALTGPGAGDGLAVDSEGGVWVAMYGGGALHHYTSEGVLDEVVDLPVSQPTSLTFAGPDLNRLVVTTSSYALERPESGAGAVFEVRNHNTRGLPVQPFTG
ncbi:SMP-30/gluconolactonase/LRE family protein [Microbacterium sp. ASV49]|uniref:SMP-30/gluconolactonase/LRE family protein n=1 Tax=Microbacterium candidum TaxID=3041922 RepID=A0ABT7MTK9_9MICO|nr:SMP-30/gluconolactonase/LRE family protein [Microbacterium sp. ASV49]MDL9977789.1 SMP-30/gluconolactonase/LRE family protein [Microbacterium sp. ASV49]